MNNIYDCVKTYNSLLNIEYNIVIGRKGKNVKFKIQFDKKDCFHLMGLQYLTDIAELSSDRGKIFEKIKEHKISLKQVETSAFYKKIEKRVDMLPYLEILLDSNEMIFKYNQKNNQLSLIRAEYLLSTPYCNNDIYIFLDKNKNTGNYFCRSFFPKDKKDYTIGQTSYTLLYKEKINTVTGKREVQYDKLYSYRTILTQDAELLNRVGLKFDIKKINDNQSMIRFYKCDNKIINSIIGEPEHEQQPSDKPKIKQESNDEKTVKANDFVKKSNLSLKQVAALVESGIPFKCKKTGENSFIIVFERANIEKINKTLSAVSEQEQPPHQPKIKR